MTNETKYPRVLIVYHSRINMADPHGVSIRGWFAEWPRERLAQIYSGGESTSDPFCSKNFKLGPAERRFGKTFFRVKASSLGEASLPLVPLEVGAVASGSTLMGRLRRLAGRLLLNSGLWEVIFRPVLSAELRQWVYDFRPDIIYCQGYTLGFTWLPLMLRKAFSLPVCFQTGDDWPSYLYRSSPISLLMSLLVRSAAKRLIQASEVRLSNGEAMAEEYLGRYGVPFEPLMMCDDYSRFHVARARRLVDEGRASVVYSGSLGLGRCTSVVECCLAALELQAEHLDVSVVALATVVPPESMALLKATPNLTILPAPCHEDLPAALKGADILLLPESFEDGELDGIRLSISTKAHLYMMSERPVLVYGHPKAGVMDYARRASWGIRVERQDKALLKEALRSLLTDEALRDRLAARGKEVALRLHDSEVVRGRFLKLLAQAANEGGGPHTEQGGRAKSIGGATTAATR